MICVYLAIGIVPSGVCSPRRPQAGERKESLELRALWAINWLVLLLPHAGLPGPCCWPGQQPPHLSSRVGLSRIAEGSLTEGAGHLPGRPISPGLEEGGRERRGRKRWEQLGLGPVE